MSSNRWVGHVLLWIGFLAGAYIAVQHAEIKDDKWSTIQWPLYAAAVAVGTVGVVVLRTTQRQAATHSEKLESDIQILEISVQRLLERFATLEKQKSSITVFQIRHFIDAQFMSFIDDFVEARETLIHSYGMQPYADLMTDFAIAERNINRAWSASADGYIDEAWASIERAKKRLVDVEEHLMKYKNDA